MFSSLKTIKIWVLPLLAAGCVAAPPYTGGDPDLNEGFRVSVPGIPPWTEARLRPTLSSARGKPLLYKHSDDSGRSPAAAIIIDACNELVGMDASRDILGRRYPEATLDMCGDFKERKRYYHVWKVTLKHGDSFLIFIDATYFHCVL